MVRKWVVYDGLMVGFKKKHLLVIGLVYLKPRLYEERSLDWFDEKPWRPAGFSLKQIH